MAAIFSRKRLTHLEEIGSGKFGTVYKAKLKYLSQPTKEVAIKRLEGKRRKVIIKECDGMAGLEHPNIVNLLGITLPPDGATPLMIMDYLSYGDLQSYIKNNPGGSMKAEGMVKLAYGVACGMAYLHHEIPQVLSPGPHGDLAARNCLVGPEWSIKVGDFGRFDPENDDQYYNGEYNDEFEKPFPIRWMPRENLPLYSTDGEPQISHKGDVWAYGVLLFEIWARGSLPYKGLGDLKAMIAIGKGENPMTHRDVSARTYISDLMKNCWNSEPSDRPDFKFIKQQFEDNDSELIN